MTLPDEEIRALLQTREFLFGLLNPKKTPRVPSATRLKARALLKHYPYTDRVVEVFAYRARFTGR